MQKSRKYRDLTGIVVLLCTVMIFFRLPVQAQTSEVEFIGMRKYPFYVVVADQALPVREKNRLNLSGLTPGELVLQIVFNDTSVASVMDTLILEPGLCYVYRIAREKEFTGFTPFRGDIRRIIGGDSEMRKPVFRLKLLEVVSAKQEHSEHIGDSEDTVNQGILVHTTGYHFTRQEPARVVETTQSSVEKDVSSLENDPFPPASAGENSGILTEAQLMQLVQRLKGLRFEEERMQLLEQSLKQRSFTSQQLFTLLGCFDFERSKVRIFKLYFTQLLDPEGHTSLYRAFDFNSTIDELKQWVNEQR